MECISYFGGGGLAGGKEEEKYRDLVHPQGVVKRRERYEEYLEVRDSASTVVRSS